MGHMASRRRSPTRNQVTISRRAQSVPIAATFTMDCGIAERVRDRRSLRRASAGPPPRDSEATLHVVTRSASGAARRDAGLGENRRSREEDRREKEFIKESIH